MANLLPKVATAKIIVNQVRELSKVNSCKLKYFNVEKHTATIKAKTISDQNWSSEILRFDITEIQSEIVIDFEHKTFFGSHKVLGRAKIPVPKLKENTKLDEWLDIYEIQDVQKALNKGKTTGPQKKIGEVRINATYEPIQEKKKRHIEGLQTAGEWTKETTGGLLGASLDWWKNPQFLLNVDTTSKCTFQILQPEDKDTQKITFFLLKYDRKVSKGLPKLSLDEDDYIKFADFRSPIPEHEPQIEISLEIGEYVLVPCPDVVGYTGEFIVNIRATKKSTLEDISCRKLPLEDKENFNHITCQSKFTNKNQGGFNVSGASWRINPQFLVQPQINLDVSFIVGQAGKDRALGLYIVRLPDIGHWYRAYEYKDEIAKTPNLVYQTTAELESVLLEQGQKYAVIVCTNAQKGGFDFEITAFSSGKFSFEPLTDEWPYKIVKESEWNDETAGGSPSDAEKFLTNPQFLLTFSTRTAFMIDLIQLGESTEPVGFMVFEQKKGTRERVDEIIKDDIYYQPKGWVRQKTVTAYKTVTETVAKDYEFVIIPSTLKPDIELPFDITILADQDFTLERLGLNGIESSAEESEESPKEQEKKPKNPENKKNKSKDEISDKEEEGEEEKEKQEKESEPSSDDSNNSDAE